jgi:beta-lactamase regulating signal transducer with metallopeptidase domain
MIGLWMLYSTTVAVVVGIAAATIERVVGSTARGRRWAWMVAVGLAVAIPALVLTVDRTPDTTAASTAARLTIPAVSQASAALSARVAELLAQAPAQSLARHDRQFAVVWTAIAALALCGYGLAVWSLARRRKEWRTGVVDGQRVLVSSAVGPAVVGALNPEIVVPEWSLGLPRDERALMIEHERQHVRARDPLMLHGAAIVAMLMPWNVGLWWLNRRLRLAVELDCDARVLARGHDVRVYGNLLLNVCARRQRVGAVLAPALFERTSSLTKRVLAMSPRQARFPRSRFALGVALAAGIVAVACEMPTPEMLAPDGKNAETRRLLGKLESTGHTAGLEDLKMLVAEKFASVARGEGGPSILFVVKSSSGDVVMTEVQPAANAKTPQEPSGRLRSLSANTGGAQATAPTEQTAIVLSEVPQARVVAKTRATNLVLPVGVGALRPEDIATVDVSKHAAGVVAPKAVSIITIVLKPGAKIPQ